MDLSHFINGAVSGMFGVAISHPIDTIKTSIQDSKPIPRSLMGLYKGIVSALTGVGLEKAIVFGTYENMNRHLCKYNMCDESRIAISGALSGLSASMIVTPVERLKILAQTGTCINMTHFHPFSLFKGLSATFTREVPGFAIYFSTYEFLKRKYCRTSDVVPIEMSFVFGGISGGMAWFGIYPQDVIKTRMQSEINGKNTKYFQMAHLLYNENGIRSFFKGFHLALLRAVPLHSGTFMMMEVLKKNNFLS